MPVVGAPRQPEQQERDRELRSLRARWRTASLSSGWRFPSDWGLPEVDAVCAAVLKGASAEVSLAGLARARAASGAGLAETLADLAALHAVLSNEGSFVVPDVDATPSRLLRVTAVAWADVAMDRLSAIEVIDPLTGLPTAAYLRTRLDEIYRQAGRDGLGAADGHLLLAVAVDLSAVTGWQRLTSMILTAEAVRSVFDGGESVACIGPSSVAVLVPRDGRISARAVLLRRALNERLAVDSQLADVGLPRIKVIRLPSTHDAACELINDLGRG